MKRNVLSRALSGNRNRNRRDLAAVRRVLSIEGRVEAGHKVALGGLPHGAVPAPAMQKYVCRAQRLGLVTHRVATQIFGETRGGADIDRTPSAPLIRRGGISIQPRRGRQRFVEREDPKSIRLSGNAAPCGHAVRGKRTRTSRVARHGESPRSVVPKSHPSRRLPLLSVRRLPDPRAFRPRCKEDPTGATHQIGQH